MYQDRENKMGSARDIKGHETWDGEMAFHISGSVMRKAPAQGWLSTRTERSRTMLTFFMISDT